MYVCVDIYDNYMSIYNIISQYLCIISDYPIDILYLMSSVFVG